MDLAEKLRRVKRLFDSYLSSRKALLLIMMVLGLVLYLGPSLFRWVRHKTPIMIDPSIGCVALNVDPFLSDVGNFDANLYRSYESSTDKRLLSFVGNGKVGFSVDNDNTLYVHNNRTLSLALPFHPGVEIIYPDASHQEGTVVHFVKGTVFRYQCFNKRRKTISVSHTYYAHRTIPSLLVQNIKIVNPLPPRFYHGVASPAVTDKLDDLLLRPPPEDAYDLFRRVLLGRTTECTRILQSDPITFGVEQKGSTTENLQAKPLGIKDRYGQDNIVWHGKVPARASKDSFVVFALVTPKLPNTITVEAKSSTVLRIQTLVEYSAPVKSDQYPATITQLKTFLKDEIEPELSADGHPLGGVDANRPAQFVAAGSHWFPSPDEGVGRGRPDRSRLASSLLISYRVGESMPSCWPTLSHSSVHLPFSRGPVPDCVGQSGVASSKWMSVCGELWIDLLRRRAAATGPAEHRELQALLAYPEHCYGGHHTLQASTLWTDLSSLSSVTNAVTLWMLTLENQGCSKLMKSGAEGVLQAMVLSLGAFLFKDSHLELNTQPKDLHRELFFRRISYGNATHLNVSVVLGDDNKALLRVLLDRSDRDYYACDGGCLDPPVKL
ncbi:hypothetical protein HPB47_003376, partial [Ixodes persulcatus]